MPPASISRRAAFHSLHTSGCFVMPNPWDPGSAHYLHSLGFKALGSTSAGFGFSRALPDAPDALPLDLVLAHLADLAAATPLPLHADFQNGYADAPEAVAKNVRRCIDAGVAGLSIEDATGNPAQPLYDPHLAADRIRAAREAINAEARESAASSRVLLTARAECYLVHHPDPLRESIRRLRLYAEAGADVLFAPGAKSAEDIRELVQAAAPLPYNAIITSDIGLRVPDLAALGVRRISTGSTLSRVAWGAFMRAANEIATDGSFTAFAQAAPFAELNALFSKPR